jgi:Fe-S cluster assembly scaffold protein SufB
MNERAKLAGVAVDVVFDSVSVATTYKEKLAEVGVLFCSISEAVQKYPDIVRNYLGTVVPSSDNYYAALNSAVFTDGSFCFIPKGVKCPMDLSTYFRINTQDSGQFERTLIIAEEGASVSYLEGCTAPKFDTNQLHAAVVELVALERADIKYSTVQNWYAGDANGVAASTTSSRSAACARAPTRASPGPRSRRDRRSRGSTRAACCSETGPSASSTRSRSPTTISKPTRAPRWFTSAATREARS